jgi:hypothetical protein
VTTAFYAILLFALLLSALFIGCAPQPKVGAALTSEEREEYITLYGAFLSESKRSAFTEGRVIEGMSKELVERLMGLPKWTVTERYGIEWFPGYDSTYLAMDTRDSLWLYYGENQAFTSCFLFRRDTLAEVVSVGALP